MLEALQSAQPPPTEALLTTLLNEITTLSDNFILVLDDYHVIDSQPVDQALTFLVDHLPPQMHLVIASREDPPTPVGSIARPRPVDRTARRRFAVYAHRSRRVSQSRDGPESFCGRHRCFGESHRRLDCGSAISRPRLARTQGQSDATRFIESFTGSHHFVLDYLLEEVLQKQSASTQSFLLGTSILDRLCGPLCEAVSAHLRWLPVKRRWNISNAPTCSSCHSTMNGRWYRYHRLFADLLRQRLRQADFRT